MVEKLNRGEWSEFYAFVKILSERKLLAASSDLTPIPDTFYPVRKILRDEPGITRVYDLKKEENIDLTVTSAENSETFEIEYADIAGLKGPLFEQIRDLSLIHISEPTRPY